MKIPRYWTKESYEAVDARGKQWTRWVWGWSCESLEAAAEVAKARAGQFLDNATVARRADEYDYLDNRPLREEIVQSFRQEDGCEVAVITRNRYGSLVLNTDSICFVDVDFPPPQTNGFLDGLALLFSAKKRNDRARRQEQATLESIATWARENPNRSFRLYRTAAGLRLLFTDGRYDPASAEVGALLDELNSDELYKRLTLKQECFRARLTPKPWRCGCPRPPCAYPWSSEHAEQKYKQWQAGYDAKSQNYATCVLVDTYGVPNGDDSIAAIILLHDQCACSDRQLDLA